MLAIPVALRNTVILFVFSGHAHLLIPDCGGVVCSDRNANKISDDMGQYQRNLVLSTHY